MEDYPEYEGLIAQLNGTIVDADMACSAVLGYARSSLGEQSLAVLEHNEFQNMVGRKEMTERFYLPQSERRGPASASASRGMSTTCDPAAHGAT